MSSIRAFVVPALVGALVAVPVALFAPPLNVFVDGTVASAPAVNANFQILSDRIAALEGGSGMPSGTILPRGTATVPTGFLACEGQSLLRADYPALFGAIGTSFGAVDATHFNLPDLRGRFLRGADASSGRDPDAAARTACLAGGSSGASVGSCQADMFRSHTHDHIRYAQTTSTGPYSYPPQGNLNVGQVAQTSASGGNETRPLNVAVAFIIKT